MLQIQQLKYSIGPREILKEVQLVVNPGSRIALIGANGAGKTTLLRILAGELEADTLAATKPAKFSIGYLPQEEIAMESETILLSALRGRYEVLNLEQEILETQRQLELNPKAKKLLDKLGELEERFRQMNGYALEITAKKTLSGLGFHPTDFQRNVSELSGGWKMRVYLARLLLQEPDLLLLDEPTNHLDLESLQWIESYLKKFSGSIMIVSHDRFFIDRLATEIAELERGKITSYKGNYHFYIEQKELLREQALKKWQEQEEERKRLQKFIDRFRYKASKAPQVQSRIKQLEKFEQIELPEDKKRIHFKIKADTPSYKEALKISNLYFKYDKDWVLNNIHMDIYRGDKIALVGVNGAGKTTLTRLISKELAPQKGSLKLGERVHTAYYAQHQTESLNLENSIYQEVMNAAADSFRPKLRDILGVFQFTGDDINKKNKVLSGGEKARVSLAKILLSPSNFIIMDEPTNHLDLQSKEALEESLKEYDGTLLLISHDRYFLDKLVSRVFELRDGQMTVYEGNYSDYLAKIESRYSDTPIPAATAEKNIDLNKKSNGPKSKVQKQEEARIRQKVSQKRNALKNELETLESELEILENKKQKLENKLAEPETYKDGTKAKELNFELEKILRKLNECENRWEDMQLSLEEIESNMNAALNAI
jgi:ATP-binding cassette subfamily F protein 3